MTQARLAMLAGYDSPLVTKMCQGRKELTGPSGRERVVRLIAVLRDEGALTALGEAIFTHPTTAEGLLGLFASPPSAPGPMQSVSSSSVNGPCEPGAVPATTKE